MLQLTTTTRKYHTAIQHFIVQTYLLQMIGYEIHDLTHSCLNDIRQVLYTDLLCGHTTQTGDRDKGIGFGFIRQGTAKLHFHLLRLCFQYTQSGFDIISDILSTKRNHSGMLQNPFIKNSYISSATTDIHNGYTGFHIFLTHYSSCRCERLQYKILGFQPAFLDGTIDITNGIFVAGDNMKIRADLHTTISDRISDVGEIIYSELLWDHINDLITGRDISFALVFDQLIDVALRNFICCVLTNNVATSLQTLDMMTGNTYVYF